MATPERDTVYKTDGVERTTYTRESNGMGWFVGIIVALALLAIGYLVFSANSGPGTTVDVDNAPVVTTPADPAIAPSPMTEAPAAGTTTTPMAPAEAPAMEVAPATEAPAMDAAPVTPTTEAPAAAPAAVPAV